LEEKRREKEKKEGEGEGREASVIYTRRGGGGRGEGETRPYLLREGTDLKRKEGGKGKRRKENTRTLSISFLR